jgi:hypothetical protein
MRCVVLELEPAAALVVEPGGVSDKKHRREGIGD